VQTLSREVPNFAPQFSAIASGPNLIFSAPVFVMAHAATGHRLGRPSRLFVRERKCKFDELLGEQDRIEHALGTSRAHTRRWSGSL
jgi:hypothetical protein